ncbi:MULTISPECIES: LemA family protein [Acinetobacter]|uniref:LemA family protein n=1 Tax=Acinetobacter corruptisaponis TaxID=3045147 RepID=A0ABY8S252_9GAMM|nr:MULTISPECIES: LemA family protein [Acinetobacter]MDH0029849.1 LemA family protein [Acinetobacter sp. GD04021]MDH0885387.1 LemA family protein [Acinetobacter sp. GD03873]MDH1081505.1 LemA family protein [Acinetobacter sp. GD03983]MDH2188714.1 LemA family protein [Acinetobacter sp. GD03645]MDH2203437.1 LemA family protein [Acinetobacter sp. GD03647]
MKVIKQTALATVLASTLLFTGCGYNTLQVKDEAVNASWSEVQNQYQRRADLVPNLVNVVKGYAKHEEQVLTEVTQARSNVAGLKVDKEVLEDPALFEKYQQAQSQLTGALSRLIAVSENYPDLKANEQFRDLQAQLEGTENRIAVARNRYITTVQDYNAYVRQFPQVMTAKVIGMKTKENFKADSSAQQAPTVSFN